MTLPILQDKMRTYTACAISVVTIVIHVDMHGWDKAGTPRPHGYRVYPA